MSMYIGNLICKVTPENLSSIFAEYGAVKCVQIPTDRETGRSRGFGFVEMESEAKEEAAIQDLDDVQ